MFRRKKITIKEINKYLNQTVDALIIKYGKVSYPDFEKELEQITGIKWKMVKNYRNHPKPTQVVRPNAKIKQFVYKYRHDEYLRQIKNPIFIISLTAAIIGILGMGYYSLSHVTSRIFDREKVIISTVQPMTGSPGLETKNDKHNRPNIKGNLIFHINTLGLTFKLGKPPDKLKNYPNLFCQERANTQYCQYSNEKSVGKLFHFDYLLEGEQITSVGIITTDNAIAESLKQQIKSQQSGLTYENVDGEDLWYNDYQEVLRINMKVLQYTDKNQLHYAKFLSINLTYAGK